jgi:hypothetical protein
MFDYLSLGADIDGTYFAVRASSDNIRPTTAARPDVNPNAIARTVGTPHAARRTAHGAPTPARAALSARVCIPLGWGGRGTVGHRFDAGRCTEGFHPRCTRSIRSRSSIVSRAPPCPGAPCTASPPLVHPIALTRVIAHAPRPLARAPPHGRPVLPPVGQPRRRPGRDRSGPLAATRLCACPLVTNSSASAPPVV